MQAVEGAYCFCKSVRVMRLGNEEAHLKEGEGQGQWLSTDQLNNRDGKRENSQETGSIRRCGHRDKISAEQSRQDKQRRK